MSGEDLLKAAGGIVAKGTLSAYANGWRQPPPEVARRLAQVLGVKESELFDPPSGPHEFR